MAGVRLYLLLENGSYQLGSGKLKDGLLEMEKRHFYLMGNPVYERRKARMAGIWHPFQSLEDVVALSKTKPERIPQTKGQLAVVYSDDSPVPVLCEERAPTVDECVAQQTTVLVDRARRAQVEATKRDNGSDSMMGIGLLVCALLVVVTLLIVAASRAFR